MSTATLLALFAAAVAVVLVAAGVAVATGREAARAIHRDPVDGVVLCGLALLLVAVSFAAVVFALATIGVVG